MVSLVQTLTIPILKAAESIRIALSNSRAVDFALPTTEEGWLELNDGRQVLVTSSEAEDLVQETMLQVFRKWDSFRFESPHCMTLFSKISLTFHTSSFEKIMKAIKRDDLILLVYKLRLLIYPFPQLGYGALIILRN